MASRGQSNFIWIVIAIVIFLAVVSSVIGWGDFFGEEGLCAHPRGCQCGMLSTCRQGQTCERRGPFGSCSEL